MILFEHYNVKTVAIILPSLHFPVPIRQIWLIFNHRLPTYCNQSINQSISANALSQLCQQELKVPRAFLKDGFSMKTQHDQCAHMLHDKFECKKFSMSCCFFATSLQQWVQLIRDTSRRGLDWTGCQLVVYTHIKAKCPCHYAAILADLSQFISD